MLVSIYEGKSTDKNSKLGENLSLIDEIINKELKSYLYDSPDNVVELIIQNDNDFKLNTKSNVPIANNNFTKQKKVNRHITMNTVSGIKEEKDINNDIIEVNFVQKSPEKYENNTLVCENETLTKDQNEGAIYSLGIPTCTDDLKSDLQSLLIMMAISNTTNDHECAQSNIQIQNGETVCNLEEIYKKEDTKTELSQNSIVCNEITSLLKIKALQPELHNKMRILRKYAKKWINYVKQRRENDRHRKRLATINKFFDRLEKKEISLSQTAGAANKAKVQARDYSSYQHRYKVQKHIIALQRAKLEQQNRLIEELKYNKIVDASRQSLDVMKEDVRQTYYEIDKHLKPKIKCLTNELKIREIEDNSLVLHCLKVPQFLQRMEARAREREEKHAIIRERRKQMEDERIRLKLEAELAKAEMDKEEKAKIIKELREKRKREKIENIRKKQYAERLKSLIVMADLHYEKCLITKYGIRPFKLLVKLKRDNMEKAKAHYVFQLKKNVFLHWMWYTEDMWYERNFKADEFYRRKLLQNTLICLQKKHNEYLIKMQVAKDYYELYITQLVFKKFQEGILILKKEFKLKWNNAVIYYNSNLLFKTLTCWRTLPALNALKREQDARKRRWREKVLQVVPDYVPPED